MWMLILLHYPSLKYDNYIFMTNYSVIYCNLLKIHCTVLRFLKRVSFIFVGRISRQLLEHSADANLQESVAMETALHRAVVLNMLENIKVLTRSRQVDVNRRDLLGENALHKAYKCRDLVVWEGLLVAGGDVTARSSMGYTPLMKVLKERNTVAAAMMYQYSAMSPD